LLKQYFSYLFLSLNPATRNQFVLSAIVTIPCRLWANLMQRLSMDGKLERNVGYGLRSWGNLEI